MVKATEPTIKKTNAASCVKTIYLYNRFRPPDNPDCWLDTTSTICEKSAREVYPLFGWTPLAPFGKTMQQKYTTPILISTDACTLCNQERNGWQRVNSIVEQYTLNAENKLHEPAFCLVPAAVSAGLCRMGLKVSQANCTLSPDNSKPS